MPKPRQQHLVRPCDSCCSVLSHRKSGTRVEIAAPFRTLFGMQVSPNRQQFQMLDEQLAGSELPNRVCEPLIVETKKPSFKDTHGNGM